jgi:hypothetical protein
MHLQHLLRSCTQFFDIGSLARKGERSAFTQPLRHSHFQMTRGYESAFYRRIQELALSARRAVISSHVDCGYDRPRLCHVCRGVGESEGFIDRLSDRHRCF